VWCCDERNNVVTSLYWPSAQLNLNEGARHDGGGRSANIHNTWSVR
jgi:hypothetical protein